METLIIRDLNKNLNGKNILEDINLEFETNTIYGLIGNNGAGKTTFFRTILGLTNYLGTIEVFDGSEHHNSLDYILGRVGTVMPFPEKYDMFTINEVFDEHLFYMGVKEKLDIIKLLAYVGLNASDETKISKLSLGMKQKLNIVVAVSHNPNIMILDEPFNGLDRTGIGQLKSILKNLKQADKIVIISSHSFGELEDVIDEVIVLDNGKVIAKDKVSIFSDKNIKNLEDYFEMVKKGNL